MNRTRQLEKVSFEQHAGNWPLNDTRATEHRVHDPSSSEIFGLTGWAGHVTLSILMRFPSLACLNEADESAAFLALAWQELFDPETPDSYQPKLFNTRALIEELADIGQLAAQDPRWVFHVQLVQAELSEAAKNERLWLDVHPWSANLIDQLVKAKESKAIENLAKLFASTSTEVMDAWSDTLRCEAAGLPKNKKKTLAAIAPLATYARRLGFDHLDAKMVDGDGSYQEDCSAVIERICNSLNSTAQKYRCIVRLRGDTTDLQSIIENTEIRFARIRDFPLDHKGQSFKADVRPDETAVFLETSAYSSGRAAAQALRSCRLLVDTFNLYRNRSSIEI